ncbi:MAG: hypothetical protein HY670_07440 [Chloroflexi bacterium]|nr:hypothetical protein [Chloroflexota bacterium]
MTICIKDWLRETGQILLAPVVTGIVALVLFLLGLVPAHLEKPVGLREYDSVEEAQAAVGFKVAVPAYFPSYLAWPPARIEAQLEPVPLVKMLFLSAVDREAILLIHQIQADSPDLPIPIPWIETVRQRMIVAVNTVSGELVIGKRANGEIVNALHWRAGGQHFIVVTIKPVNELLRLAQSMHSPD